MGVDVFNYAPVLSYTDEPVAIPDCPPPGTEVWVWKVKVQRYLKVEHARRNKMLLAKDDLGRPLYILTESGNLSRTFPLSESRRKAAIARDKACVWCGSGKNLEVDHIIRYVDGGGNGLGNLRVLCRDCHSTRGGRP